MALNLQQIRDYVRSHLDIEAEDLPDDVLDVFIRDGSKRVERAEPRWPFYETSYLTTLSSGSSTLEKAAVSPALDQVVGITQSGGHPPLKWIGFDALGELQSQRPGSSGRPQWFAEWAGTLHFFPAADADYQFTVHAYRKATDWMALGTGATPDLPDELHNTVATWALSRAYLQQEDPEMAAVYERQFADELNEYRRRLTIMPHNQPLVLNGGVLRSPNTLLLRPRFDWEVS